MRLIPVLDFKAGQAVLAIAGDRARYQPLRSVFYPKPDPLGLARGLREGFGATEVYVADLDAIEGVAEPVWDTLRAMVDLGLALWLDLGIKDGRLDRRLLGLPGVRIIAALETLRGPEDLARMVDQAGPDRITLSLDLRDGVPILPPNSTWLGDRSSEANLVAQAVEAGPRSILRLDLATVGTNRGVADIPPTTILAPAHPGIEWATGGGVAHPDDLATLARLGYSAALVGSAIHDGRIKGNSFEPRMEHG